MDQVITFDKSLQQRLQEYNEVLGGYEILPVSAIGKEWSFYVDLTIDPNGWQAVWKVHRSTCEALNIQFPCVILVFVLDVDVSELRALVKVLAVQDDIHLPKKHWVPLIHLWPTKDQDKTIALNLQSTANVIDMLRFFYQNLVFPWDLEEDDSSDWKSKHLEHRLRLYYEIKNGVLPRVIAEHIHSLIFEAKRIEQRREILEGELEDDIENDGEQLDVNNPTLEQLMELHIRLMRIKTEIDVYENPLLRRVVIKTHKRIPCDENAKQNIWVIQTMGTADDCVEFLQKIKSLYPTETLLFAPLLSTTLESANSDDVFLLKEGVHKIDMTGALEHGGVLKGISSKENTTLTSKLDNVMLDFKSGIVLIENVTIKAVTPECAILVRHGQLTLNNCKLIGDGKSSIHQGIIVLNGASLQILNCDISEFNSGIVGNSGSKIEIENSVIHNCNYGLKIFDNCSLKASKVKIENCKEFGICLETENSEIEQPKAGDFDTLNM